MSEETKVQQAEEKKSIFRKKSLDRISSPEELDGYLAVTGPGVWLPLITAVFLLIGCLVWMTFGQIETTLGVAVAATDQGTVCYVPYHHADSVKNSGSVRIADHTYPLADVGFAPQVVNEELDESLRRAGNLSMGDLVLPLKVDGSFMTGFYSGEVVVETLNPIRFIIN